MRSKHSREQQQPRAWGTRFDYLDSSPPPAQSSSPVLSPTTSPHTVESSPLPADALTLELFGANAKPTEKRDWADDDVPSTLFSPGRAPLVLDIAGTPGRKDISKQPHDASVFVGSLPPDADEADMAQLLAQHLSRFKVKVQNIKIVRDTKGGLCAFVQCESAAQAAQLVSQAQANPQPFMGRHLRYENARARRTLLVSYRTPMQFMPCASQEEEGSDIVVDVNGVKGRWIESDLPDALRIWKPRDVRFPIVTFRGEARNVGDASRFDKDDSFSDVAPAYRRFGVLFTNLRFDVQTINKMAGAFGPLESFKPYQTNYTTGEEPSMLLADHDYSRSPGMDPGIWEIKWEHRDDCITALNTLRRIPHLSVTWAKESGHPQTPRPGFYRTPTSPHNPTTKAPREANSPVTRGRPFLLLDCGTRSDGSFRSTDSPSSPSTFARSPKFSPQNGAIRLGSSLTRRGNEVMHRMPVEDDTDDGWTVVRPQNITRAIMSSLSGSTSASTSITEESKETGREWSEGDFPPLKPDRVPSLEAAKTIDKQSEEKTIVSTFISLNDPVPSSTENQQTVTLVQDEASPVGGSPSVSRSVVSHRRSLSNPVGRLQVEVPQASPDPHRLEIPPTPELANSSLTQSPTSAQPDPESPMYHGLVPLAAPDFNMQEVEKSGNETLESEGSLSESGRSIGTGVGVSRYEHQRRATVDPKTVFVGGLEPFGPRPWDEARLREIFQRHGEIQEIRIVTPISKKTGFAFVTFICEESALNAIQEEHNRCYDGRPIRVQIRDMFPARGGFKFRGRGIGRRPFGFDAHFDGMGHHNKHAEQNPLVLPNSGRPLGQHLTHRRGPGSDSFQVHPHSSHQAAPSISAVTESSTLHSLNTFDARAEVDSRESDSKTTVSVTPPPSALNTSTSTTSVVPPVTPQGVPPTQVGYYPSPAWASHYGSQMHYPLPYGTYGGMVPHVPMPFASNGHGTDPNVITGGTPVQWGQMYRSPVPFPSYPYVIMPPPSTEALRSATMAPSQPTTPVKGQPPLHATGFIQGDHGMLIPVYQPEALNDYMSGSFPAQSAMAPRTSSAGSGHPSSGQQQSNLVAPQMWHNYPHGPQFIAYPVPSASSVGVSPSAAPSACVPQHAVQHQVHGQPVQLYSSGPGAYATPTAQPFPVQQQAGVFTASGANMQGMPQPPFFLGAQASAAVIPPATSRSGPLVNHATHGSERSSPYTNKQPPRRDPSFHHDRNGQHRHGYGSNYGGARSPSTVRPANGFANMHAPRAEHHQNNSPFQQRQRHVNAAAASPLQLGFNKHIQDGGQSQQHQWMTNFQQ